MPMFSVSLEKRMYATGHVEINADNAEQAVEMAQKEIDSGSIKPFMVEWSDHNYEQCSFNTTGDVDEA